MVQHDERALINFLLLRLGDQGVEIFNDTWPALVRIVGHQKSLFRLIIEKSLIGNFAETSKHRP